MNNEHQFKSAFSKHKKKYLKECKITKIRKKNEITKQKKKRTTNKNLNKSMAEQQCQ